MDKDKTLIVKTHDVILDDDYTEWIRDIKDRYKRSQIKAAVKVNTEQLSFNWQLGRDLVTKKAEEKWGSGIVEQISLDLQSEFPGVKGFSTTNLWYMKKWYEFYFTEEIKLQQAVGEIAIIDAKKTVLYERQCKDLDHTEVQLSFRGITTPMGVATYNNVNIEEIQKHLPTAEQFSQQVKIAEEEFYRGQKS